MFAWQPVCNATLAAHVLCSDQKLRCLHIKTGLKRLKIDRVMGILKKKVLKICISFSKNYSSASFEAIGPFIFLIE
jgi:hypothetical protein